MSTSDGDPVRGATIFRQRCSDCHTAEKGGEHNTCPNGGPNLYGVLGREVAKAEGYNSYSTALQYKSIVWTEDHLFVFLKNPKKYIPGTKMLFNGLKKESDRSDLVSYLRDIMKKS